ncbi:MAG: 3'-5' exonuclease domain-containing protein 2 [Kiritimatiellae bacterium]|nr:3'-5' exonuclease domain-containing protein 2 [Kiritimatiellia bacterium]MDW8459342.1 3'-5' exonuclease [Verrucomicrobiota bacterium]
MRGAFEQLLLPLGSIAGPRHSGSEGIISITRDALNSLPIISFKGRIHLVDSDAALESAIRSISRSKILGFDTETKPVFKVGVSHPPALVQLADEGEAWIFQLKKLKVLAPLFELLSDTSIIKAGIALADDLKKLRELHPFQPGGFAEIGDLAKKLGFKQTGLRSLAGLVLGVRVSKREQRSNWARHRLKPSQVSYAATDAWISRELYIALQKRLNGDLACTS